MNEHTDIIRQLDTHGDLVRRTEQWKVGATLLGTVIVPRALVILGM